MSNNEPCKGILQRVLSAFGKSEPQQNQPTVEQMRRTVSDVPAWKELRDLNRVCEESAFHVERQKHMPLRGID